VRAAAAKFARRRRLDQVACETTAQRAFQLPLERFLHLLRALLRLAAQLLDLALHPSDLLPFPKPCSSDLVRKLASLCCEQQPGIPAPSSRPIGRARAWRH
jgi:hypothetical protein